MKNNILTFVLFLLTSIAYATEISVNIKFENYSEKALTNGEFRIISLNKTIQIYKEDNFSIILPKNGKYQFSFSAAGFTTYTIYPAIINKRKKTITVKLFEEIETKVTEFSSFPTSKSSEFSVYKIEKQIKDGKMNFIIHGIDVIISDKYLKFKEKYGIGFEVNNCVLDPLSFKSAIENNKMIVNYLNEKFGSVWQTEIPVMPIGMKKSY